MGRAQIIDTYPVITTERLPRVGKEAILRTLGYLGLGRSDYFVIGGANLVLRGIKATTEDVDMLVSGDTFDWLAQKSGAEIHDPPLPAQLRGADNKTVWVKNRRTPAPVSATTSLGDGYYPLTFDAHLSETELVQGVPCLTLEHVRASKEALQRYKDIEDLAAIAHHLGESLELPEPIYAAPYLTS